MQHQLQVMLDPVEGALVRMLALVERRCFPILAAEAKQKDATGTLEVKITIRDQGRSVTNLCRQLEKLVDVIEVNPLRADGETRSRVDGEKTILIPPLDAPTRRS